MTKRDKIFLYAGGVFVGLAAIYLLIIEPVYSKHLITREKIEQKGALLKRYKAILERGDKLKERVAYIKNEFKKVDAILLSGEKPSLAASELQGMLDSIFKKARVTIKNVKNKKPEKKDMFYIIPVESVIKSTLRELSDVINNIEKSNKFLYVKELYVRLASSGDPEKLESKLVVEGLIKNSTGK